VVREVPKITTQFVERFVDVPQVEYIDRVVEVPQVQYVEKVVEVPKVQFQEVIKHVAVIETRDIVREVPRFTQVEYVERIVEVPEIRYVDKVVEVPEVKVEERIRHVPKIEIQEVIRHVPKFEVQIVERFVEVPEVQTVEKIVEVPQVQIQEVVKQVPKFDFQDKIVHVPRVETQFVERIVEVPEVQYRDKWIQSVPYVEWSEQPFQQQVAPVQLPAYTAPAPAEALAPKARGGHQIRGHLWQRGEALPEVGSQVQLEGPDGSLNDAVVLAVDASSVPPRARVRRLRDGEAVVVPIVEADPPADAPAAGLDVAADQEIGGTLPSRQAILDGLNNQWKSRVQDYQEKGAVGTLRGAAVDAVDLLGDAAREIREKGAVTTLRGAAVDAVDILGEAAKEIQEKGAVNTLRGAAVDAVDLLGDAAKGAQALAGRALGPVQQGDAAMATSDESAHVRGAELDPPVAEADGAGDDRSDSILPSRQEILDGINNQWKSRVQDYREKGAVGTLRGAAVDAVDLLGDAAKEVREKGAVGTLREVAVDAVDLLSDAAKGAQALAGKALSAAATTEEVGAAEVSAGARETNGSQAAEELID